MYLASKGMWLYKTEFLEISRPCGAAVSQPIRTGRLLVVRTMSTGSLLTLIEGTPVTEAGRTQGPNLRRELLLEMGGVERPATDGLVSRLECRITLIVRQEFDLDPEIFVLLEGMPVEKVEVGAPSVTQPQHEAGRARVQITKGPKTLDALYVTPGETVMVGIETGY